MRSGGEAVPLLQKDVALLSALAAGHPQDTIRFIDATARCGDPPPAAAQ